MMTAGGYELWYQNNVNNQPIAYPVDLTIEGMKALLADEAVKDDYRAAAAEFLKRTQYKTYASNLLALFCSLGAAFSSMAYFLLIRGHSLDINEWEFLIAPTIVGLFVAGATWYTYRHDTAEWMLDFSFRMPKDVDSRDICVYLLTFIVVAMEIALSGYGVTELGLGESETAMLALVCLATLVPEWAQTHKYFDKWIKAPKQEVKLEGSQQSWFTFYRVCSVITLGFWGMAIFPLLEENSNEWVAGIAVAFYILLGKPYMKEKALEQVKYQSEPNINTEKGKYPWVYPVSRIGNGIGDLAFASYGFFEALKAFDFMKEDAKPIDSFDFHGDESWKTCMIIISAVVVVATSCVGSFLMSAGGDQKSYGDKINEADKLIEGRPPPSTLMFSSMWHKTKDVPSPEIATKPNPT